MAHLRAADAAPRLPLAQNEAPRLLNYLTAPNVVIWSAACASCALTGLFEPVEIVAKNKDGELYPWSPPGQKWSDGEAPWLSPSLFLTTLFDLFCSFFFPLFFRALPRLSI